MRAWAAVPGMLALLLLAGCGAGRPSTAVTPAAPSAGPTQVTITRSNPLQQRVPPLGAVVVDNPATVHDLYSRLLALPAFPAGMINCPADFGVSYGLAFVRGGAALLTAKVDASGCQGVHLSDGTYLWAVPERSTGPAFWSLLAATLGLTPAQLTGAPGAGASG